MPSAPEAVQTEAEVDSTAQQSVHAELEPSQPASSSEVIVDSDSVYSVCCSDVTTDTADDIVRVETPPVPDRGATNHLLSFLHFQ